MSPSKRTLARLSAPAAAEDAVNASAADPFSSVSGDRADVKGDDDDNDDDNDEDNFMGGRFDPNVDGQPWDPAKVTTPSDEELVGGMEKVDMVKMRLAAAIHAENMQEHLEHLGWLQGDRNKLADDGVMAFGLTLTMDKAGKNLTLTRDDGRSFKNGKNGCKGFKLGMHVDVFQDFTLSQACDSSLDSSSDSGSSDGEGSSSNEGEGIENVSSEAAEGPAGSTAVNRAESGAASTASQELPVSPATTPAATGNCGNIAAGTAAEVVTSSLTPKEAAQAKLDELKAEVKRRMAALGVSKVFDGVIESIQDYKVVVKSRADAAQALDEAGKHDLKGMCWAMASAHNDCTFRRQLAAVESLSMLLSAGPGRPGSSPGRVERREEEIRVRKVILSSSPTDDEVFVERAASCCVEWLGPDAQADLSKALEEMGVLNAEQLAALNQAATRSLTLLQGPPGTGKSSTLAAMGVALCQVFHNPATAAAGASAASEFELLSSKKCMAEWTEDEVQQWIQSFSSEELKALALHSTGGCSGRDAQSYTLGHCTMLFDHGRDDVLDVGTVKALAGEFIKLRDATLAAIEKRSIAPGFWQTQNRDMRIIMCAETNTAANRLLKQLVSMLPADSGYHIVRLGIMKENGEDEEGELARKYYIDAKRDQHPLMQVNAELRQARQDKEVSQELGRKLQDDVVRYVECKVKEAKNAGSDLLREKWGALAQLVKATIVPKVGKAICDYLKLLKRRKGSKRTKGTKAAKASQNKKAWEPIKELLKEMRELALYDILVAAQVVVGTNASVGEITSLCTEHGLSFPIVLMDEAGQVSEPSSLIPLILGAEWVLMAGDLKQLRPTIRTNIAKQLLGYDDTATGGSEYGRLRKLGVLELTLARQYRMHPDIREFPSWTFYDGLLFEDEDNMPCMDVPQPSHYGCRGFKWPSERPGKHYKRAYPIAFFDVRHAADGYGLEENSRTSYINKDEASLALQLMMAMACDPSVRSIFILTPYKAQAEFIAKRLEDGQAILAKIAKMRAQSKLGKFHALEVKAHTADGFQVRTPYGIVESVRAPLG
ncbi:putative helicase MAGATAMA 3 [Tetrabaena socialis]|uniref:Putative helicase MAGATAMA 3 n=1 Tax=Tetrabaena socialis TaxID=47790 RepID=A0A2J8A5K9_9CHLO|nr:putative helicase MAGATAMA 3 [Tetrabaena socialis]|eukprot:PNH07816.1 putative helicase MAGATAMA 3 [Tetrabaena socialis]